MPGYHLAGMAGRLVEYPILPEDWHLSPAGTLRRRPLYTCPENRGREGYQVAQNAEFRYMDSRICQYCTPIVPIRCKTGSKMIANGRFWTEDRLMGQTMDPETRKNRFFRISPPVWMIQDPCHRIDGGTFTVRHDPPGYSLRRRLQFTHPKTGARKGIRLHKRANSGTSFWEYGIIGLELPGIDMKRAPK